MFLSVNIISPKVIHLMFWMKENIKTSNMIADATQ